MREFYWTSRFRHQCLQDTGSDVAYKELIQLVPDMPTFYALSSIIKELDANETPGKQGVQVSFEKSLSDKIRNLVRNDPGIASHVIEVKFLGMVHG